MEVFGRLRVGVWESLETKYVVVSHKEEKRWKIAGCDAWQGIKEKLSTCKMEPKPGGRSLSVYGCLFRNLWFCHLLFRSWFRTFRKFALSKRTWRAFIFTFERFASFVEILFPRFRELFLQLLLLLWHVKSVFNVDFLGTVWNLKCWNWREGDS